MDENSKDYRGSVIRNENYYFKEGASWNDVAMSPISVRYTPAGFVNNAAGPMIYSNDIFGTIALLNSIVSRTVFEIFLQQ